MKNDVRSLLMLILTAFIWGSAFVAQRKGMEFIGPFTFNGFRCYIAVLFLLPVFSLMRTKAKKEDPVCADSVNTAASKKALLSGGLSCGILMFIASTLQQIGMVFTTSGKAGFITAMYIIIVPVLGTFMGKKVRPLIWFCVTASAAGLYLLTIKSGFSVNRGDLLILACAFFFSLHILAIDHFSPRTNPVGLSAVQFAVTAALSTPFIMIFEKVDWPAVRSCMVPLLYAGILSCGVAYTLQIAAQKKVEPTIASLLLSLESVFAAIAGAVILGESLSLRELAGCILMFTAIILAQLPERNSSDPDIIQ